jgi:hypothetical protein
MREGVFSPLRRGDAEETQRGRPGAREYVSSPGMSAEEAETTRRSRLGGVARKVGRVLMGLLREIGDENAYRRHLEAHGCEPSGAEWRRFSEERMRAKYARAKCC